MDPVPSVWGPVKLRHRLFVQGTLMVLLSWSTAQPADFESSPEQRGSAPAEASVVAQYTPGALPGMVREQGKAYVLMPAVWTSPSIPVCWEPSSPTGTERDLVRQAIHDSWESASSRIHFLGWGNCAPNAVGIRIAVRDDGADDGPETLGLGIQLDGRQAGMVMNFSFQTWGKSCATPEATRELSIRSIAVHEFGHALAFAHEQNRPDAPGECVRLAQGPNGDSPPDLTPYDPDSVMNYCAAFVMKGGVLVAYAHDGKLSQYDLTALKHFYGS
jgi:hypothetical protein